jgi:hypothetical protein
MFVVDGRAYERAAVGHDDNEDRHIPTLIDTFDVNRTIAESDNDSDKIFSDHNRADNNNNNNNHNDDDMVLSCFDVHVDDIAAGQFHSLFRVGIFLFPQLI